MFFGAFLYFILTAYSREELGLVLNKAFIVKLVVVPAAILSLTLCFMLMLNHRRRKLR